MPVEFLTEAQRERYGYFSGAPSPEELARHFHFDDADHALIAEHRGDHNRLGFALQLGTVRFLGTFLANPVDVPPIVVAYVGRQIDISEVACLLRYMERKQTRHAHSTEIQRAYQYQDFNDLPWRFRLSRWLYARAWLTNERPSHLFDLATHWLIHRKVLLPGATTLTRLIAQIRDRASLRAWQQLAALPTDFQRAQLEALLIRQEGNRRSRFDQLRKSPTRVSSTSMIAALKRYEELESLGIRGLDFSRIPPMRLKALARYAATGWAPNITRMPDDRRMATLVAFAHSFEAETLDDALDIFDMLITDIAASAKKLGQKHRLRTLRDLDQAAIAMAEIGGLLLDESCPDSDVRATVFARFSQERIAQAIKTIHDLARPSNDNYQEEMLTRYRTVRRFLPHVLEQVTFKAAPAGQPVMDAVIYLTDLQGRRKPKLDDAPLGIVDAGWKRLVVDKDDQVSQPAYTLCILERLQDRLRRRDIYVEASERWGDPRAKLLQGRDWEAKRTNICRSLNHPSSPDQVVQGLSAELDAAYRRAADRFSKNESVHVRFAFSESFLIRLSGMLGM